MGGLIAYRLTLAVAAAGDPGPDRLLLGGCQAPGRSNDLVAAQHKPEPELAADLMALGGMSPMLRDYPDWRRAAVDLVRADLRLCATGMPPAGRVGCPVHVFTGVDDPLVSVADARAWQEFTTDTCAVHQLPGGHLFLLGDTAGALLDRIAAALARQHAGTSRS
jgi:surfactin synthase thioesterase subunit